MNLFEDESFDTNDWFSACPNSVDIIFEEKKHGLFYTMRQFMTNWDRLEVANMLLKTQSSERMILDTMNCTMPNNPIIQFVARELTLRVDPKILFTILAFSSDGTGRGKVLFPDKQKAVPNHLLKVFGLRPSEGEWFAPIAGRIENVRAVISLLKDSDYEYIIYDKPTVLNFQEEQATASLFSGEWGSKQ